MVCPFWVLFIRSDGWLVCLLVRLFIGLIWSGLVCVCVCVRVSLFGFLVGLYVSVSDCWLVVLRSLVWVVLVCLVCLVACLFVSLCVRLSFCLSGFCLSVCLLLACSFVCLSFR